MAHSYNIVKDGSGWFVKTRKGGMKKSGPHNTKRLAISAARNKLPVGSNVYVYYATKGGLDHEFTIRGK